MTWFEDLTGIDEESPEQVRNGLSFVDDCILCPNGKKIAFGRLEIPKLSVLRTAVAAENAPRGRLTVREVVGDVRQLHRNAENLNALFQVASQFNLLEMSGPSVTPERGVGIYEHDHTQGPRLCDRLRSWNDLSQLLCSRGRCGWAIRQPANRLLRRSRSDARGYSMR